MAELINLRMVRKRAKRAEADARANGNRTAHGITRTERKRLDAERSRAASALDQHRRQTEETE